MGNLKYGRKPAVHTLRGMRRAIAMAAALDPLGAPPDASNNYIAAVTIPWGTFLNDQIGDCVPCDTAHTLMLRTANVTQVLVPKDADVTALYSAVGGYVPNDPTTDNGCDENAMCNYLVQTGFLGHKADATGPIDPTNFDHLRWCIQLFGSCRIGLNLPNYAEDQFSNELPWDVNPGADQSLAGGHDVPLVDYRGGNFTCITWGKAQIVTPDFLSKWCVEAHSELYFDWVKAQGTAPSGFDLNTLAAKMGSINATS